MCALRAVLKQDNVAHSSFNKRSFHHSTIGFRGVQLYYPSNIEGDIFQTSLFV